MAKIFSMAGILSLFVLSISGNSFAQKHGWQLQAQAFRDQFDHSSSFKPAKGGALVMMRQLGQSRYFIQSGFEFSTTSQTVRFPGTKIQTQTLFWRIRTAMRAYFAITPTGGSYLQIVLDYAWLRPQSFEVDAGILGMQRISPKSDHKFMPGISLGYAQKLSTRFIADLQASGRLISLITTDLAASASEKMWQPVWRLQAGVGYAF